MYSEIALWAKTNKKRETSRWPSDYLDTLSIRIREVFIEMPSFTKINSFY